MDRWLDGPTYGWMGGQMDKYMDEWADEWMDGWADEWMGRQIDGWIAGMHACVKVGDDLLWMQLTVQSDPSAYFS